MRNNAARRLQVVGGRDMKSSRASSHVSTKKKPPEKTSAKKRRKDGIMDMLRKKQKSMDMSLLLVIIVLVVFGLVMVFSASAPSASAYQGNPYHYIVRQAFFAAGGILVMLVLSKVDYHIYSRFAGIIFAFSVLVLFLVYVPGLGVVRNNARRWINLGISTLQPSEITKVGVIIFFANGLSKIKDKITSFKDGLIFYLAALAFVSGVLYLEPHLSALLVICAVGGIMLIMAGAKIRHFCYMALAAVPALVVLILSQPYQLERVMTFLDPFADSSDAGFQVVNSLYAIGSGGMFGLGLGMSRQKFLYLPEPQNDFIFAIVCEELGWFGAVLVIGLFVILIYKGFRIAQSAPDMFGTLLAGGITTLVAVQAIVNIAVVTGSLPATGMALPFFSYGGTSLFILLGCMGMLLNISRQTLGGLHPPSGEGKE